MITLRPYQTKCINTILDSYDKGERKMGICLSTGLGKTVIFSGLIKEFLKRTGKKALVLAHREELLSQAQQKIMTIAPELVTTIEQGTNHADPRADVVIASVATLGRNNSDRINKFNPEDYSLIIIDEFHHSTNATYTNILAHFHTLKNIDDDKKRLLLGVSATAFRSDNQNLEDIIDSIVFEYDLLNGIRNNFLSNLRAFTVKTNIDISDVKKSGDDFNIKELGEAVNKDERNKIILETYQNYCKDQQTLIFCVNVEHAQVVATIFKNEGILAEYVTGETPTEERKLIVDDFLSNKIHVLIHVNVFSEGSDLPNIKNIIMARPTRSLGYYIQAIGRATRLSEGKTHAIIYDIVDNASAQGIRTMSSILGVEGNLDFQGKDLVEIKDFVDKLKNLSPNIQWDKVDVTNPDKEIERLDLLAGLNVPEELSPFTIFNWAKLSVGQYKLSLGNDKDNTFSQAMFLRENALGQYEVYLNTFKKEERKSTWIKLYPGLPLTEAISNADTKIKKEFSDKLGLINRSAPWRKQEPTEKQLQLLTKMKVNQQTLDEISKGQASVLLDKLFSEKPQKEPKVYSNKQKWFLKKKGWTR